MIWSIRRWTSARLAASRPSAGVLASWALVASSLSQTPATVSFKILPPVWRRWWLLSAVGAALLAGVVGFERYRAARLKEINNALTESRKLTEELTRQRGELRRTNRALELQR